MATVNLTPTLRDKILDTVATPFEIQYKEAATLSREDSIVFFEKFFITPEQRAMMDALPKEWVNLSFQKPLESSLFVAHKTKEKQHWFMLDLPKKDTFISYGWANTPHSERPRRIEEQRHGWIEVFLESANLPFETPYLDNLKRICEERDTMCGTVTKILDKCATLNQVEKIWPAVRKYVEASVVERLDRKNAPRTAASVGIDEYEIQDLNVATIRMQMTK